jgi:dihydrofolate reductase
MKISLIAALTDDGVIGKDGKIPWHISEDLKRFKAKTMGCPVIMGRKTFESIVASLGKPLPGRTNVIITRNKEFRPVGTLVFGGLHDALMYLRSRSEPQVFVIGGGEIYREAIERADEMLLTYVHEKHEGDTFFPKFDAAQWEETFREEHGRFTFVELSRKNKINGIP